jgi:hypothetical protein
MTMKKAQKSLFALAILALMQANSALTQEKIRLVLQPGEEVISAEDWPEIQKSLIDHQPYLPTYFLERDWEFTTTYIDAVWFDVNNDGVDELFLAIGILSNCGTAGCSLFVLERSGEVFAWLDEGGTDLGGGFYLEREAGGTWVLTSGP